MADGQLGEWILGAVLGAGTTSSVHLATHVEDPSRKAAVKVLAKHHRQAIARFRQEAEILSDLDHPHIIHVLELDLEDRLPYLVMEYIPGRNVWELMDIDGPPPIGVALDWARQILDALVYLHARNVYHRDLCTPNLVVHDGKIVIVDFGLARPSHGTQVEVAGTRIGDVVHAPPEWSGTTPVSGQVWDLYAFGVVLFELLTGVTGFPRDLADPPNVQTAKVMTAKRTMPCLDPGELYPDDLRALIRDLTARDARERLKSAKAVQKRLATIEPPEHEPHRPTRIAKLSEGFRQASTIGNVVTGLLSVGAIVLLLAVMWRVLAWLAR